MADRYWVGGTANWDGTAGTKWATTSGGTGGASVPTSADDVFFTNLSTGTCTISAGNTGAKSINCTGFAGTIAGTSAITVSGSITLSTGMTYSHTGTVTINGNSTLTTAGKSFSGLNINGSGITVTLGDALNISTRVLTVTQGNFDTANYNVSAGSFNSNNSNTRTITFGSSTVTVVNNAGFNITTSTNLTFNVGTSQINITGANPSLFGGSLTYYNVSFTSTSAGSREITGTNTFNNLTLNASASGLSQLFISANQTVNGTFTCAGSSFSSRGFVRSDTIGTTRTITANSVSADDCDFRDITIAGAASPISPTRAGDCGGNSGITFPSAKTVYRVGTDTTWAGSSSWALTSGGSGSDNNFPLPQDTAVINNDTALVSGTISLNSTYNIGTLDCSNRTNAISLNQNNISNRYGSFILGSGVSIVTGASAQTFSGRGTMTFTSAGKSIIFPIIVDTPTGTFELGDATTTTSSITLTRGTLDAKTYNLTCSGFLSTNSNTRTLTMGSGLWTLSGFGAVWDLTTSTNLTLNKGTANILLSNTTTSARSFSGGGLSYNKLTIGGTTGTSTLSISGTNSFTELASTKTVAHTIRFSANQGTIDTWSVTGTAGNIVTVDSNTAGTRRNFTLTNVTSGIDYLSVKDIGELSNNKFYVGANSTDGGNNSNVFFTASPSGLFASASITCTALLVGLANLTFNQSAQINATGSVSSNANMIINRSASITSDSTVQSNAFYTANSVANITASADVISSANKITFNSASIDGSAQASSDAIRIRTVTGDISASATVTALSNADFSAIGNITSDCFVTSLANATYSTSPVITCNATVVTNARILGEGWTSTPIEDNTWTEIPASDNTWTEITYNGNTWLRQG